jgi:SAM-dependent methyltransferase
MIDLLACPACNGAEATLVFEHNGLVLLDYMRDSPHSRYDYRLCHTCGLVYAGRRPEGEELTFLYSRFDEFLGRDDKRAYTPDTVRDHLGSGWLRSEEEGIPRDDLVRKVYNKQISESMHVPIIAAKVPLQGKRVLELRATTGLMLDLFRKFFGAAEVCAMPISEHYRNVIDALNPMPTELVDFDAFDIPFAGTFDLVVARHTLTHALRLDHVWRTLHRIVSPGGWLYLHLENDDATMYARRKNLFGEMKCFHFQNFDVDTLGRMLRWNGFEPDFVRHARDGRSELICLARRIDAGRPARISAEALAVRIRMYEEWRDRSVLSAPDSIRALIGAELSRLEARAVERGYGVQDRKGRVVAAKPLRVMHDDGYASLNEATGD